MIQKILKHDFIFNNAPSICFCRGKSNVSIFTWVWFFYYFAISYSFESKESVLFSVDMSRLSILLLLRKELWKITWYNQCNTRTTVRQISFHSDKFIHGILFNSYPDLTVKRNREKWSLSRIGIIIIVGIVIFLKPST